MSKQLLWVRLKHATLRNSPKDIFLISLTIVPNGFILAKWNIVTDEKLNSLQITGAYVRAVNCSNDGSRAVVTVVPTVAGGSGDYVVYDIDEGTELWRLTANNNSDICGGSGSFTNEGNQIIFTAVRDTFVEVWSADGSQTRATVDISEILDSFNSWGVTDVVTSKFTNVVVFTVLHRKMSAKNDWRIVVIDDYAVGNSHRSVKRPYMMSYLCLVGQ